MMEEYR